VQGDHFLSFSSLNGKNLEKVSVIRDLGVLMDSKLILSKIKKGVSINQNYYKDFTLLNTNNRN
jgi:hypothetical protein